MARLLRGEPAGMNERVAVFHFKCRHGHHRNHADPAHRAEKMA